MFPPFLPSFAYVRAVGHKGAFANHHHHHFPQEELVRDVQRAQEQLQEAKSATESSGEAQQQQLQELQEQGKQDQEKIEELQGKLNALHAASEEKDAELRQALERVQAKKVLFFFLLRIPVFLLRLLLLLFCIDMLSSVSHVCFSFFARVFPGQAAGPQKGDVCAAATSRVRPVLCRSQWG